MRLRALSLAVMLCLCGWAVPTHAVAGRPALLPLESDPRLAPVFTRGVEAFQASRFDEALTAFEDLYRQSPRPTLLYYLGKVALAQQRTVAAADLYRRFVKGSGEESDQDTKLEVQQYLSTVPTAECEVSVQGDGGALLLVDGRVSGSLPLELPLQLGPGSHRLVLEKDHRKVEAKIQLATKRRAEVRFTFVPPLALVTLTPGVLVVMRIEPRALESSVAPLLTSAMQGALQQQNAAMLPPETELELLQRNPELASCIHQTSCLERLGELGSAQFVLYLDVQSEAPLPGRPSGQNGVFRITAKLLDVDVGTVSSQATQSCADCQIKRALSQLADTVQDLLRQAAARPRGILAIESQPPGAVVQVDGHTLGHTPYRRDTFVGRHEVILTLAGHAARTETVNLLDTETASLSVALAASAPPPNPYARVRRIAKWSLLGIGVLSTVAGATLLGLNRSSTCAPGGDIPGASCSGFNGRSGGVPLLVLGIGALGGAGALFYLDRQAAGSAQPQGAPTAASPGTTSLSRFEF